MCCMRKGTAFSTKLGPASCLDESPEKHVRIKCKHLLSFFSNVWKHTENSEHGSKPWLKAALLVPHGLGSALTLSLASCARGGRINSVLLCLCFLLSVQWKESSASILGCGEYRNHMGVSHRAAATDEVLSRRC